MTSWRYTLAEVMSGRKASWHAVNTNDGSENMLSGLAARLRLSFVPILASCRWEKHTWLSCTTSVRVSETAEGRTIGKTSSSVEVDSRGYRLPIEYSSCIAIYPALSWSDFAGDPVSRVRKRSRPGSGGSKRMISAFSLGRSVSHEPNIIRYMAYLHAIGRKV